MLQGIGLRQQPMECEAIAEHVSEATPEATLPKAMHSQSADSSWLRAIASQSNVTVLVCFIYK